MLEVRFETISAGREDHEIEVTADWKVIADHQTIGQGGLDQVVLLDMRVETLSEFIARFCVGKARELEQSELAIVFPSLDHGLRQEADRRQIAGLIRRNPDSVVRVLRFLWE